MDVLIDNNAIVELVAVSAKLDDVREEIAELRESNEKIAAAILTYIFTTLELKSPTDIAHIMTAFETTLNQIKEAK